ncbi:MAG: class I SAM-dependent methyltransferase [bacterium]|nr:class I SAM-dependent methyltransferase [bacterium]
MKKNFVMEKYDSTWGNKKDEKFAFYERNHRLDEFFSRPGKVLDLACGSGTVGLWLQKNGFEVDGIDISQVALDLARKKGLRKVVIGDLEKPLPFPDKSFDYVFAGDILEHVINTVGLLRETERVLKDDGRLIFSVPNMGYWYYRLTYLVKGEVPKTEGLEAKPWEWEHIRFYNTRIIKELVKEVKFEFVKSVGVCRKPLDNFLAKYYPDLFASILIVEAEKIHQTERRK